MLTWIEAPTNQSRKCRVSSRRCSAAEKEISHILMSYGCSLMISNSWIYYRLPPLRDDGRAAMVWARCRATIDEDDNYCSYALKYILPRSNVIKIYWFFFFFLFFSTRFFSLFDLNAGRMRAGGEGEPIGINDWHNSVHTRTTSHTFSLNKEGWEWWEAMKLLPYCQENICGSCLMSNEKCLVVCWVEWVELLLL